MKRISAPIESLIEKRSPDDTLLEVEYLVIGSGYGGAVAALRLASGGPCDEDDGKRDAEPKRDVVVLERGREYGLGDFPYNIEDLPSHVRVEVERADQEPRGYSDALFRLYPGTAVESQDPSSRNGASVADVLVGSGLGGTSLINANVAEEPLPEVFDKPAWPRELRNAKNPLAEGFEEVRRLIGCTQRSGNANGEFPKYTALRQLDNKLGNKFSNKAKTRPATITVTTLDDTNGVGVHQAPCTDCGNCVTGCNVGAKNSLDRNLLRLAKARGARMFTGATVVRIAPNSREVIPGKKHWRWEVTLQPTVQPAGAAHSETYSILADNVILAAGSLGSTELLLRSEAEDTLKFSSRLGEGFSTNGDGLIMSYAQTRPVNAIAEAAQVNPVKKVGPTITGIIQSEGLTFEDASIPAALGRVFSELVTTSAMLQRLANGKLPPLIEDNGYDPLVASMAVADHCQALLVMGDDGARGKLSLAQGSGPLQITFPCNNIAQNAALVKANDKVQTQDRKSGLGSGQFAPNPLWQLMPSAAEEIMGEGALPAGRVLTVHPLGGCAMADNVAGGVVDHAGRVFRRDGSGLYEGLYVLDGAIIPAALAVNPFLTIAALAWRNAGLMLDGAPDSSITKVSGQDADLGDTPLRHRNRPQPTAFIIQEQLTGQLNALTPWFRRHLSDNDQQRLLRADGLVVQVRTEPADGEAWLENPGGTPLPAKMQVYVNPLSARHVELFNPVGVTPAHLGGQKPLLELDGEFTVLRENTPGPMAWAARALGAWATFKEYRGLDALTRPGVSRLEKLWDGIRRIPILWNLARMQTRFRHLSYEFVDKVSGITISGEKVMGYHRDLPRLWPGLLNLGLTITERDQRSCRASLTVNTNFLVEPGLVEIRQSANLPQSLLFTGAMAAYFARCVFATNFWELAGLEYAPQRPTSPEPPLWLHTTKGDVPRAQYPLAVPVRDAAQSSANIDLKLWRYERTGAPPILLLHGLAQGSQIFWQRGTESLAALFSAAGFDVWLLDYRLSNLVLPPLPDKDWSMDEIARFDIPAAIDAVYSAAGNQPVRVFAHCVGACTLAMAALTQPGLGVKIAAAITNAIHPWVIGSRGNRFRGKFGGFLRDWLTDDMLNPVPTAAEASAPQRMLDRLAYSLARINEPVKVGHMDYGGSALAQSVCDRMSFLYGRMWNHENLAPDTHEAFIEMLGPAPLGVYQHMYYYVEKQRLTDRKGENIYLTHSNITRNWTFPTLFIHGADSRVFNPHSARRSAHRLGEILGNAPVVRHAVYRDCGHMDVIFGKTVPGECFRDYADFFADPASFRSKGDDGDWPEPFVAVPEVGPILRAAWDSGTSINMRLWSELRTNSTNLPTRLAVRGGNASPDFEIDPSAPSPVPVARYRMLDVAITNLQSPIALEVRGDFPGSKGGPAATLRYHEHAWLIRLRARAANRRDPAQDRMRFLVGSCRYPGSIVDNVLSDRVFEAMCDHVVSPAGDELLFLIGDQIYADATDQLFEVKSLQSRYEERYRHAFGSASPGFARLVSQIPTHFALDDHEIDDNWSGTAPRSLPRVRLRTDHAIKAATRYLGSGRNRSPVLRSSSPGPLYYALSHPQECDFPAFVADTRTEREFRATNDPNHFGLMSPAQYQALERWLLAAHRDNPTVPKFIFSGAIIAPLSKRYCAQEWTWRHQDGWAGYPKTLGSLLRVIAHNAIQKVVFVGGDAHLSSYSRLALQLDAAPEVLVWQIVSSGLYAPLPFANARAEDYEWGQAHTLPIPDHRNLTVTCTNTLLSDHYHQFMRVDATANQLLLRCFDENNRCLATETLPM